MTDRDSIYENVAIKPSSSRSPSDSQQLESSKSTHVRDENENDELKIEEVSVDTRRTLSARRRLTLARRPGLVKDRDGKTYRLELHEREGSSYSDQGGAEQIENTRAEVKLLFAAPKERWKLKKGQITIRRIPKKLILQVLKVIIVTLQLIVFAGERATFELFLHKNKISFHHVFLKDWTADREVLPYPPAAGEYAIYSKKGLYNHLNFAISQFYGFENISISTLMAKPNAAVLLEMEYFTRADLKPLDHTYDIDTTHNYSSITLPSSLKKTGCIEDADPGTCYDVEQYLADNEQNIEFNKLLSLTLKLELTGIDVKLPEYNLNRPVAEVECIDFKIQIVYDNSRNTGQIVVELNAQLDMRTCEGRGSKTTGDARNFAVVIGLAIFDGFVILVSLLSSILTVTAICNRCGIYKKTKELFLEHYGYQLTIPETMEFMTLWYFQHILSDVFVVVGSSLKLYLRHGHVAFSVTYNNETYFNFAGMMLGLANFSQWISVIRYLGFFDRYNILIRTINNALPSLVRFLLCGTTIYLGYLFSGLIILGPYNPKFETIAKASQSLFSLVNGDEIYATMSIINYEDHPTTVYIFSCVYLYSYIILFIYAIANLFTAVIVDSHDLIKNGDMRHKTLLHHFREGTIDIMEGKTKELRQKVFMERTSEEVDNIYGILGPFLCCLDRCVHHNANTSAEFPQDEKAKKNSLHDRNKKQKAKGAGVDSTGAENTGADVSGLNSTGADGTGVDGSDAGGAGDGEMAENRV